jgi:hypothetical protein
MEVRCKIDMFISDMCAITHSMRVIKHIMLGGTHEEGVQEMWLAGTASSALQGSLLSALWRVLE